METDREKEIILGFKMNYLNQSNIIRELILLQSVSSVLAGLILLCCVLLFSDLRWRTVQILGV